jgi:hypothetical protein
MGGAIVHSPIRLHGVQGTPLLFIVLRVSLFGCWKKAHPWMPTAWRKQTEPHQQTLPVRVLGSHLFTIAQYADEAECSCKRYLTENITRTKRILYSHLRHKEIRYKEATFPSLSSCIPINVQWEALWRMRENLTWIRMQRIFLLTSLHPPVATHCYAIVA